MNTTWVLYYSAAVEDAKEVEVSGRRGTSAEVEDAKNEDVSGRREASAEVGAMKTEVLVPDGMDNSPMVEGKRNFLLWTWATMKMCHLVILVLLREIVIIMPTSS